MQLILYTVSVSVIEDNVQDVLLTAYQFSITGVLQTYCSFLEEQMSPENCIGIRGHKHPLLP